MNYCFQMKLGFCVNIPNFLRKKIPNFLGKKIPNFLRKIILCSRNDVKNS